MVVRSDGFLPMTFYKISRLPCQLRIPPFLKSNGNHITYCPPQVSLGLWITSKPGDEIQLICKPQDPSTCYSN